MNDTRRRLLWHGVFLFLLGLITGLLEQKFTNPRMGLAAHLEGVLNGILLIAVGAVWVDIRLTDRAKSLVYWAALYGTYANWGVTTLAAIMGTGALSPVTGVGHSGAPWQETLVTVGFISVGLAIIGVAIALLWGLRRGATSS